MSEPQQTGESPEFSRPVTLDDLVDGSLDLELAASGEECEALSDRLGVDAVRSVDAQIAMRREGDGIITVSGSLVAAITQICVVTLDPFDLTIELPIDRRFRLGPGGASATGAEATVIEVDPFAEDPPDIVHDGVIDMGEVVAEELALAIDPHPRKPGAALDGAALASQPDADEPESGPFAKLKDWPGRRNS